MENYQNSKAQLKFTDASFAQAKIDEHMAEFNHFYTLLCEGNQKMNLTAITEKDEVFIKHFLDSILPVEEVKHGASVIDVGAGAGFPGLPIKIVRPDIKLTMLDALNKRVEFLLNTCLKLNISANCIHARAEDFVKQKREKFDIAMARAVAPLNTLVEYLLPFVKIGGLVLAYKGSNAEAELANAQKAITCLGGQFVKMLNYNLPNNFGERNIIVIKKICPTPAGYPRGQNKPKLKPLA